jgi:hypothetical protein
MEDEQETASPKKEFGFDGVVLSYIASCLYPWRCTAILEMQEQCLLI